MAYYIDEHGTKIFIDSNLSDKDLTEAINNGRLAAELKRANDLKEKELNLSQKATKGNITVVHGNGNYIANEHSSINHDGHKKEDSEDKKGKFFQKHPVITGILGATVAGVLLMFKFWENLVKCIERLFS